MARTDESISDSYEALTQNFRLRISQFAQTLERGQSGIAITSHNKLIALYEYILCLLHILDRKSYERHLDSNTRIGLREYVIRSLLEDEILPRRLTECLSHDEYPSDFNSLELSPQMAIEALLPFWYREASSADRYYSTSIEMIGKFPQDERGLLNKLCIRIANSVKANGVAWNIFHDMFILNVAVHITFDVSLVRSDNKAFRALSVD